jgi:hypothetical protein
VAPSAPAARRLSATWRESREKVALLTGVAEEGAHTGRKEIGGGGSGEQQIHGNDDAPPQRASV